MRCFVGTTFMLRYTFLTVLWTGTNLDLILRSKGIVNIILAGVTTDVCVHTTMRNAYVCLCNCCCFDYSFFFTELTHNHRNDMGYECLLVSDCCAATDPLNHDAAISMIQKQGGVFGSVTDSETLIRCLSS